MADDQQTVASAHVLYGDGVGWKKGDSVEVFYRLLEQDSGGYFPVERAADAIRAPRLARTDGWVPATVEHDFDPHKCEHDRVVVRHVHPYWIDNRGTWLDMEEDTNCIQSFARNRVRARPATQGYRRDAEPKPLLSLLLVRWGGEESPEPCDGSQAGSWGMSGSTISTTYIRKLLAAVYAELGDRYECYTLFVETAAEMDRVDERRVAASLQGCHVGAMYLLWPTQFDDGYSGRPGMVPAHALLALMARIEQCGVPSRFPHSAHVYRTLLNKEWTCTLSGARALDVPRTTRIDRAAIERDSLNAANMCINALELQATDATPRGVAKLGYSWEATDVRAWYGARELSSALLSLSRQPGCFAEYVFVQEYVQAVGEIRAYCIDGAVAKLLYTRFGKPTEEDEGCFTEFHELTRNDALQEWFGGDGAMLQRAETLVLELVQKWLSWMLTLTAEPQPFVRVDIFVCRSNDDTISVRSGEVTEMGASCLGWAHGPALVFAAFLRSCFSHATKCGVEDCPCGGGNCVANRPPKHLVHKRLDAGDANAGDARNHNGANDSPDSPETTDEPETGSTMRILEKQHSKKKKRRHALEKTPNGNEAPNGNDAPTPTR
ncbi:hypothetical protein M885DRAFT_494763 [Pelagophyceae sp. CCMP2097]|nr:hypothetical protein M885DRAFT_494763 [Pelagophyceae sp. CCMP2097]